MRMDGALLSSLATATGGRTPERTCSSSDPSINLLSRGVPVTAVVAIAVATSCSLSPVCVALDYANGCKPRRRLEPFVS